MLLVYLIQFAVPFHLRFKHICFFESVQLQPDGIARLAEFSFQSPEIGSVVGVQEELEEEFDAGFGSDEGVNQISGK